ncbi:MAG: uroporphyrinogen decarboxylase family protein [Bryobacteraceae bacterium]
MTHRQRIRAALAHRQPDRVPLDLGGTNCSTLTTGAHARLRAHLGIPAEPPAPLLSRRSSTAVVDRAIVERFQCDVLPLVPGVPATGERDVSEVALVDEFGVTWQRHSGTHYINVNGPFQKLDEPTPADVDRFPWPDPLDPARYTGLGELARALHGKTDYAVALTGWLGPVHLSQFMRGYVEWLEDLLARPSFVEALLDRFVGLWITAMDRILAECASEVDVVLFGDDIGTQNGPLFRPELYRRFIKPHHKRMVETLKRHGVPVMYHSCGSVAALIRDLIDTGIDALNPVQVAAAGMDTARLKREFGRDLAFWGAIDTQRVLSRGTPSDVRDEVRRRIDDLAEGGGYVLCGVHNIQAEVPPENVVAMYEAALEYWH